VSASNLYIYGDEKWNELVSDAEKGGVVHGKTEAPSVYASSMINLNICSQQLETSVTLRVFDIPASGGFLLTDWTESLEHLFEAGKELVSFRSPDEMNDLINYYKTKPSKREKIISRAKERILKEHLVIHRMKKLLETAKNIWS
jgi:spore maturation protein CgeB